MSLEFPASHQAPSPNGGWRRGSDMVSPVASISRVDLTNRECQNRITPLRFDLSRSKYQLGRSVTTTPSDSVCFPSSSRANSEFVPEIHNFLADTDVLDLIRYLLRIGYQFELQLIRYVVCSSSRPKDFNTRNHGQYKRHNTSEIDPKFPHLLFSNGARSINTRSSSRLHVRSSCHSN